MKKINENSGLYFEGKKYSFEIISRVLLDTLEYLVGSSSFRTQKEIAQSNHVSNSYVTKFKREIIYVINYLYDGRKISLLTRQTKKYFEDLLVETFLILIEYKTTNFREYLTLEKIHQIKTICDLIVGKLEKDCSLYLIEIKDLLEKENNISISTSSVHNYLQKYIKWSNKKILYYHPNRFTQRNFEERIEYIRLISEAINTFGVKNIHFMDETGFKRNRRNNGWSLIGTRTMKCDQRRINPKWNMFCMINSTGIECSHLINHSAKGIDHAMFMLHDVLPIIQEGQNKPSVIVMDNHPIHKWCENWLSEYFKEFNCHIIYMPVYSPDLNPIEEVFGVLKHYLKNHRDIWGFSPKLSICKKGFEEKRVQIFRNGVRSGGIVASLLPGTTFEDLLNFVSDRFEIDAQNIYLSGGASIMDIALIKDNDTIYIAENEGYIPLESTGCILSRELNNILGNQETKTEMVFYLNGERKVLENMDPNITLLDYIRSIGLTGTKNVCGEGGCGACAVMVSNYDQLKKQVVHRTINSCMLPLAYVDNMAVTTVEGIGNIDELHPIQERIAKTHGVQCGYCTPGFVVNTYTVLCNNPEPTVEEIEEAVAGNLCRCTGYRPIFDAIKSFGRDYDPKSVGKLVPEMNHIKCRHKINTNKFPEELKNSNQKPLILTDGEYVWFKPTKLETLLKLKSSKVDMMLSKQLKNESEIEEKLHKRKNKISTISATVVSGNTEIGYERVYKFKKNRLMVSTAQVKELKVMEINEKEGFLTVGAGTTINDFGDKCKYILDQYPKDITSGFEALHEQTKFFANHSIRNMATLGGSLYTANPLSDLYPILMSVDAIANIESVNGSRRVPVREFVISKGKTCLKPEEILVSVDIPFTKKNQYVKSYKIGRRREDSQSIINGGFMVEFDENEKDLVVDACLAYGAIWETSIIAKKASEFLIGKKFNAQTAQECMEILEKEIPIMKRLGLIDLRKDLIKNIFFKFFVEIGTKQGLIDKNKPISNIGGYYRWPHRVAKQEFEDFNTEVGQPYKHLQAYESTTGEAKFITDLPEPEGTVFCAIVPSTKACARILKIDESEALKMKGVVSFLSAKDIPGSNYAGIIIDDEEIFASKQVNYYGHPIGIIVAETDELAKEAAKLVKIEYEELPFIQTIQEAIKEQSFFELDEERLMGVGDVEKAFEESDVVVEGEMFTEHQEHFYFETENCLVIPQPDQMLIYAAAQDLGQVQRTVSIALAKPKSYVTVKMHRLGGSFGGKQHRTMYISAMAAVAAKKLRRPVKFWLDRQTDMSISGMRHAFLGKYKMGINKTTGKINSVDLRVYNNGGHSLDLSSCVMDRGLWSTDNSYHFPNIRIEGKCCKTNRVSSTAYRSFGCAQGLGIIETAIEHASHEAGLDPDFVRTANLYEVGDITPTGWRLTDSKTHRVMKECKEKVNYEERKQKIKEFNKLNKYKKRGCSILPIKGSMGFEADFMCQQSALVNIYTDGTIHISHGGTEMGQGLSTKLAQVAATALGVSTSRIRVGETATDKIANAPPTAAVTGQGLNGRAVLDACRIINERLEPVKKDLGEKATFDEVILEAYFRKIGLNVVGHGKLDDFVYDYKTKKGRQAWYVSWSGVYTEVEIDTLTGEFQILHTEFVHDAGRSLNSAIDIGQIEGGFVQGAGFWTMEKPIWAKDGHLRTRNVSTYKIPAYSDIPIKFNVSLIDNAPNPLGVYSSKATGESGFHSSTTVFFAIRNAIKAAREESGLTDFFPLKAPLTIDNIQSACNMKVDPFDVEK